MFKYIIFFILYISINYAMAGDLPNSLFQIEIGRSLQEIKNISSSSSPGSGEYMIQPDEKQLVSPLTELTVKPNKKSKRVNVIIGRAVLSDALCASEAQRLKEKYEKSFSLQFESREHEGHSVYTITKNKKIFIIACATNYQKTILTVYLADMSNALDIPNKNQNTSLSKAVDSPRDLLSTWSTDCKNIEKSRWFGLENQGEKKYMFIFCAGYTCIPYPGFWGAFDVYNDKRVKWVSETKMKVSNNDKDAGWDGHITFNRCHEY